MSVSLEYLERCSAETGFGIVALEKAVRLGELAGDVARHPLLGDVLALKGGTALNLCFGPPERLSVDLDYNYIGQVEREKMLDDRPRVEEAILDLARRGRYGVQRSADAFAGRKLYLRYWSVQGQEERIEVDLNFLFRLPLGGTEMRTLWQPAGLDWHRVRVVGQAELLIGKLLALLDRGAARDTWDVAHLPAPVLEVLPSPRFRAQFIGLAATLDHPLPNYSRDRLARLVTERAIAEQLGPMLTARAAPRVRELAERAWAVVAPFVNLTAPELKFLAAVAQGELRPDLLFPDDPEEASRLAEHPAVRWKIANVREHLARPRRLPREGKGTDGQSEGRRWR